MRKESLKKDNRNGSVDDISVSTNDEASTGITNDAKHLNGKLPESNGTNDTTDPLAVENDPATDPFDALVNKRSDDKENRNGISGGISVPEVVPIASTETDSNNEEKESENGEDEEEGYEVEEIVNHKYKGKNKLYLIRWKGYGPESDTWEPESSLSCPEIIERYHETHPDEGPKKKESKTKTEKKEKKEKKQKKEKKPKNVVVVPPRDTPKRSSANQKSLAEAENEGDDYEVEEIVNDKIVEDEKLYLVRWKGYPSSQNTWEPESSLSCPDLIKNYENNKGKKSQNKAKAKKKGTKAAKSQTAYEVEKIVNDKIENGKKLFRIRWKGYGAKDDTWEPESSLSCPEIIKAYKNSKKDGKKNKNSTEVEEVDYEVERIVDEKTEKGKKFYLVKWKGYPNSDNSWEPQSSLSCPDLIAKYNDSKPKANKGKGTKRPAPKSKKRSPPSKKAKNTEAVESSDDDTTLENGDADADKEWEVEDIVDVRTTKAGQKEYLIRWKDCDPSTDTWEPEDQVNCPDIIQKFEKSNSTAKSKPKGKRSSRRV